jgi:hypothetical protein
MKQEVNSLTINGVEYIKKDSERSGLAVNTAGLLYVIIRTYSAGVHAGYLKSHNGKECELLSARRLWYWAGAASLSQLAMEGVSRPEECKFPVEVQSITLTEVIEIISCTEKARLSIAGVSIWKS